MTASPRLSRAAAAAAAVALFCAVPPAGSAQQVDSSAYAGLRWRMIGPFRGGRTVGASGVPGQPNVFYVGVNNGGVWKTTDAGRTWNPIFDDQPTGSIGALAVAPSRPNIIYVGSGEGLQRPDLAVGDGIYKSTDAGRTWTHLGLRDGQQIGAIIVDPKDADRLFVAVLGHPYGPNEERGVFRSTDGGQSFEKVLYRDENTGAIDLAFDPTNAQTVYAVLWAARQAPWEYGNAYSGPGSGLFRSTDGGTTWHPIGRGLPSPAQGLGRIGIAIAPTDPRRMYAIAEAPPASGGLYRSDDAGESWTRVNHEERVWGRAADFAEVKVDPRNADDVYVANTSTYRSSDGGRHFTAFKGAPGGDDYHRIWFDPEHPGVMLLASDQGATVSVNGGQTWSSWYNQATGQMFHVAADNRFPYWVYGGQQESGSAGVATRGDYGAITVRDWHTVGVEEYGYAAPDPLHPGIIFGGKVSRYDERTGQVQDVGPEVLRTGKYRYDRTAPVVFSRADPHLLYFAAQVLFRTANGGRSWDVISPDLTRPDPGIPASLGIYADSAQGVHRGVIYSIAPSPRSVNVIWVGTDDGLIQTTSDGGAHWHDVTPPEMTPWSKVTQMDAGHFDVGTAYASVSRLRVDDLHPYIYRTHDGGKSWTKIVTGLPDAGPVDVVREDPVRRGLLYAGTEDQAWFSLDDGDHWQSLRLNMPATSIRDLVVHDNDLAIATHGRSFWILDDVTPLRQLTPAVMSSAVHLFRPEPAYRVRRSVNTDTPLPPEEPVGENPPDGAIIDYWLGSDASGPVTLEILDGSGAVVRRYSSAETLVPPNPESLNVPMYWVRPPRPLSATAGMHRFVWDLYYTPATDRQGGYPMTAIAGDTPRQPLGLLAAPGTYSVRLTANGRRLTQPLTITMDPRVTAPAAELARGYALDARVYRAMQKDYQALSQVKSLRAQLAALAPRAGTGDLARAISSLDSAAARVAGLGGGSGEDAESPDSQAGATLAALNGQLGSLLAALQRADAAPTSQAVATAVRLEHELAAPLARWTEIRTHAIPALDLKLRAANLPEITLGGRAGD